MGMNWGGLAGGVAAGLESGERMRLARERDARDSQTHAFDMQEKNRAAEQRDRQEAAFDQLASLIDQRTKAPAAPRPASPDAAASQPIEQGNGVQTMPYRDDGAGLQARALPATSGADSGVMPLGGLSRQGEPLGGRPIDTSRPKLDNADGTFSTEKTIGFDADGKYYVVPTIVNGRRLSSDEAIAAWGRGENKEVGVFNSREEGDAYAKNRTDEIGRVRGPQGSDAGQKIGFGLYQNTHLLRDPGFLNEAAQIFIRARMPEGVKWLERGYKAQQENAADAMKAFAAGNAQRGIELFNAGGQAKIEGAEPITEGPDKGKWSVRMAGRPNPVLMDPAADLKSLLDPKAYFEVANKERDDARAAVKDEADAGLKRAQADYYKRRGEIEQQNADSLRDYRQTTGDAATTRASRPASGSGRSGGMNDKDYNNLSAKVTSKLRGLLRDTAPSDPTGKKMNNPLAEFTSDITESVMADVRNGVDPDVAFNNRYAEWGEKFDNADRVLGEAFDKAKRAGSGLFSGKSDSVASLRASIAELEKQGISIEEQRRFVQATRKDMALFREAAQGVGSGKVRAPGLERSKPASAASSTPATPTTREEVMALPAGTRFINPANGQILVKK